MTVCDSPWSFHKCVWMDTWKTNNCSWPVVMECFPCTWKWFSFAFADEFIPGATVCDRRDRSQVCFDFVRNVFVILVYIDTFRKQFYVLYKLFNAMDLFRCFFSICLYTTHLTLPNAGDYDAKLIYTYSVSSSTYRSFVFYHVCIRRECVCHLSSSCTWKLTWWTLYLLQYFRWKIDRFAVRYVPLIIVSFFFFSRQVT